MSAKCASCGVNDANGPDGLCGPCRKATDKIITDAKKGGKK